MESRKSRKVANFEKGAGASFLSYAERVECSAFAIYALILAFLATFNVRVRVIVALAVPRETS